MAHTTPSCCADHLAARPHRRTRSSISFAGSSSRRSPSARIGVLVERYLSHEQSPSAMPADPLAQIALDGRESGLGLKAPWLHSNLLPVGKAQDRWGPVGQFTGHFVPPNRRVNDPLGHRRDTPDPGQCKDDGIKLRQQACRTTGTPARREAERSLTTPQSEPVSLARLSTRPTLCVDQLARSTLPEAHGGSAVRLPPPMLAPRVVSRLVQLEPSGPIPKLRSDLG